MSEDRPVVVAFRRDAFYGDFKNTEPKWHILGPGAEPDKWGTYVAWCGYAKSNLIGSLRISRSKTPKKASETCGKCLAAIAKAEKQQQREERLRARSQGATIRATPPA